MSKLKKTCFVIMGYGKKTDYQTGRVLDLDAAYHNMIKPAVEAAGLECIRADEIVHSGVIDVPMYQQLLTADVVVADLSTYNCNAFYELGVRHALRPFTTITIAEEKLVYPFDVNHIVIRRYKHLGDDIGVAEANRFTSEIKKAITTVLKKPANDSPVYEFLKNLTPPMMQETAKAMAAGANTRSMRQTTRQEPVGRAAAPPRTGGTLSALLEQAEKAKKSGDFAAARKHFTAARQLMRPASDEREEDPYLIQCLALVTYESKQPTAKKALEEARALLAPLKPETSNDTETLRLWGTVHKRLWEETRNSAYLDEAIRAYERGFNLRNDYHNGINLAYLLNVRAAAREDHAESIADFVQARRVRREVIAICEAALKTPQLRPAEKYWALATLGEAYLGVDEDHKGRQLLNKAYKIAPDEWMKENTREQLAKLQTLLADSPLKHVAAG